MFRQPLWLLALPAFAGGAWLLALWAERRRRGVSDALGKAVTLARSSDEGPAGRALRLKLRAAALSLLAVALAGPQFGVELVETRSDARQVVVAVDVSLSMKATDVKPDRLERAKAALSLLIDQLKGERVGVVAFAGDAQVICPLTQDADAAKQLLGALEVGAVPTPGTAIGTALRTSTALLGRYPGAKAVVLLTDGEDHKSDPVGAAREASAAGVRVFAVGIGTPDGEPIPTEGGGYHKDAKGSTVVSRLDEGALAQIARDTGGAYYRTTPGEDEVADIVRRVKEGDAAKGLSGTANLWRDRYQWPAGLAFLLLLIELSSLIRRPLSLVSSPLKVRSAVRLALFFLALSPFRSSAASAESELRKGNHSYDKALYEDALSHYAQAQEKRPKDPRPAYNAGAALYRLERPDEAAAAWEAVAADPKTDKARRQSALYNLGDARYKKGDYAGAAEAFRGAVALDPKDAAARRNLAVAVYRQRRPPPQRKKQEEKKKEPEKPQEQKKDDQKKQGGGGDKGQTPPSEPRTRPQDRLTKDEADRVMRAVQEREKQAQKNAQQAKARRAVGGKPPTAEDW